MSFFIKYINENTILPKEESISAVFLIAIKDSKILAIENERGWEIPGGHVEQNETYKEALIREVKEESGATFSNEKLLAIIESDNQDIYKDKVMLIYATEYFTLGEFTPNEDAFDREIIEIEEFLQKYNGSINLNELVSKAQDLISKTS